MKYRNSCSKRRENWDVRTIRRCGVPSYAWPADKTPADIPHRDENAQRKAAEAYCHGWKSHEVQRDIAAFQCDEYPDAYYRTEAQPEKKPCQPASSRSVKQAHEVSLRAMQECNEYAWQQHDKTGGNESAPGLRVPARSDCTKIVGHEEKD